MKIWIQKTWQSRQPNGATWYDLDWFFDCLDTVKPCPAEDCRKRISLAALIVHLNDDHRWTREDIAAWLAGNEGESKGQTV